MQAHGADAAVVVAYGLILPKTILEIFRLGCFNLHASLLPRWRGAAPIHRAIMAGDGETGVRVMRMDEGLDTGPIAMKESLMAIGRDATTGDLHDALARARRKPDGLAHWRAEDASIHGNLRPQSRRRRDLRQQDRQERDAHRLDQAMAGRSRPLPRIVAVSRRVVRASGRSAGSKSCARPKAPAAEAGPCVLDDKLTIACGDGAVRLVELQRAGRKPMAADEFLRGTPVKAGAQIA